MTISFSLTFCCFCPWFLDHFCTILSWQAVLVFWFCNRVWCLERHKKTWSWVWNHSIWTWKVSKISQFLTEIWHDLTWKLVVFLYLESSGFHVLPFSSENWAIFEIPRIVYKQWKQWLIRNFSWFGGNFRVHSCLFFHFLTKLSALVAAE